MVRGRRHRCGLTVSPRPDQDYSGNGEGIYGYGGGALPADAIRALASPAATAARDSIRWVSGAEPASVTAGHTRRGGLPGGAVAADPEYEFLAEAASVSAAEPG